MGRGLQKVLGLLKSAEESRDRPGDRYSKFMKKAQTGLDRNGERTAEIRKGMA